MVENQPVLTESIAFILNLLFTVVLFNSLYPRLRVVRPIIMRLLVGLVFIVANAIMLSSTVIGENPFFMAAISFSTFSAGFFGGPIAGLLAAFATEGLWTLANLQPIAPITGLFIATGFIGGLLNDRWEKMLAGKLAYLEIILYGIVLSLLSAAGNLLHTRSGTGEIIWTLIAGAAGLSLLLFFGIVKSTYDACQRSYFSQVFQASQQLYEGIINSQQEMVSRFTPDGTLTFVNRAFANAFGHDMIGRSYLDTIPEEDREEELAILKSFSRQNKEITYTHRAITRTGDILWKERTSKAFFNKQGEIIEIQSVGRDITRRKLAELELEKYRADLENQVALRTDKLQTLNERLQVEAMEREKVEKALSKSETLYRMIFETSGTAMAITNRDRSLQLVNQEFTHLLGYENAPRLPRKDFCDFIHPDSHPVCTNLLSVIRDNKEIQPPITISLLHRNGQAVPALLTAAFLEETEQTIISLISMKEQHQQRAALEEAERLARLSLDGLPDAIAILNDEGQILTVNEAWRGSSSAGSVGDNYFALTASPILPLGDSRQLFEQGIRSVLTNRLSEMEIEYQRDGGTLRWFKGKVRRFPWTQEPRVIVAHEDITEQVALETELREARDDLARILEVSCVIVSTIDYPLLLESILNELSRIIPYDGAAIISIENGGYRCEAQNGMAWLSKSLQGNGKFPLIQKASRMHETYMTPDIHQDKNAVEMIRTVFKDAMDEIAPLHSWMGVPLVSREKLLGAILLTHRQTGRYDYEMTQLARTYANIAATAIDNALLVEQIQQTATDEERNRLARELHDSVSQTLFSASLIAEILPGMWDENPAMVRQGLNELYDLTQGALAEMRTLLLELRPAGLTEKSLDEILRQLTLAVQSRSKVPIRLKTEGDSEDALSPDLQIALYRITQEALNNIIKHAAASAVEVILTNRAESGTLLIRDDGCGFDLKAIRPGTIGMMIMHERAKQAGITLSVNSAPDRGTEILLTWNNV